MGNEDFKEYDDDDDEDEEDLGEIKERRQRRLKNKTSRDKNKQQTRVKAERLASRPRQRFNMSNFDLDDWEEWGGD